MAKLISYVLLSGELTVTDQFSGENNATQIQIDYTGTSTDTWAKWLDIRLPDGTGTPVSLGTDLVETYTIPASLTKEGMMEIQPYAIDGSGNKTLWKVVHLKISRSLNVNEDNVVYDPTVLSELQDTFSQMQLQIDEIYTDYENGVFNASVNVGTTTTGDAGTEALVENIGTPEAAILNFTIPQGIQGIQGIKGDSITNITSEKVDDTTTITITGTFPGSPYVFTVDDGIDGIDGTNVESVTSNKVGTTTTLTITGTFTGSPYEFTIEDGYTPIKDVDYFDGEDGYTPIKGVDYFDGEDGYTPIKDVDYFDGLDGTNISSVTSNKVGKTTTVTIYGTFNSAPYAFDVLDGVDGTGAGDMLSTNNLSDVADVPTAVANLGLDTKMEQDGSDSNIIRATFADGSYIERDTTRGTWIFADIDGTQVDMPRELYYPENKASGTIGNGVPVQFAGAQGDHTLSKVAVPSEINANPRLFMGLSTKAHVNNDWTKIANFGVVHDVDTNGFAIGTILYYDSVNGGLTNILPPAPYAQIEVGAVMVASSTAGAILVRVTFLQNASQISIEDVGAYYTSSDVEGALQEVGAGLVTKAPLESPAFTGTVSGITKAMVGLGNVDNTSDVNKPISTAQQTALDSKLSLTGGTLTGALNGTTITTSGAIKNESIGMIGGRIEDYSYNGTASVIVNYRGYQGGTTQFRDLSIFNGKEEVIAAFRGSGKYLEMYGGIKFPATQNPSADANTLDDYEEGTWTGTLTGTVTAPSTPQTANGQWVKVGKQVTVAIGFLNKDTTGASGSLQVTGLPYFNTGNTYAQGSAWSSGLLPSPAVTHFDAGLNSVLFVNITTGVITPMTAGTGRYLLFTLTYIANS